MGYPGKSSPGKSKPSLLLGMDREQLTALVTEAGAPSYRVKQIMDAVYRQRVETLQEISTLPQDSASSWHRAEFWLALRGLKNKFVSSDGTVRYLIGFGDGQSVETGMDAGGAMAGKRAMEARLGMRLRAPLHVPQGLKPRQKRVSPSPR